MVVLLWIVALTGGFEEEYLRNNVFYIVNAYACSRQQPSLETLYKIAEILQVNVKDLLMAVEKDRK
jgi:hypothetical protein